MTTRFASVDLSGLPAPAVIEALDYEVIVKQMRDDLVARYPDIAGVVDLESEPLRKIIEVVAYRELLLRARINDSAKAVLLPYATGTDLDNIAALFGVPRAIIEQPEGGLGPEGDARLRQRVILAAEAFSTAGAAGAYVFHALSQAAWALDATAIMTRPGHVRVTVQRTGASPIPSDAELRKVADFLASADVRPLTDMVQVLPPAIKSTAIRAVVTLSPGPESGPIHAEAIAALAKWAEANRRLGMNLRRSAIISRLHVDGVHSVDLIEPAADLICDQTQVYDISATEISVAPYRDE